ncbi:MAG: Tol-Pal system beta propeller repeat protein TolB [Gammaproteobacteria bacterium]|nr:Tol-Pal system beta propeller repeat protein TolB [Gammaproteobacteria bacterium]
MNNDIKHRLLMLPAMLILLASSTQAELRIEVTKGVDNALRVAIVPFDWRERDALPENVSAIITNDLKFSGRFETLPVEQMLSMPHRQDQIFFRDWRLLKVEYVLIGRLTRVGEGVQVNYELYDVHNQSLMLSEAIAGSDKALRDMAHHVSDVMYEKLTGIEGVFSTRIMYVTARGAFNNQTFALNIADADGHRARQLFSSKEPIMSPDWSPDGKKVTYVSYERDSKPAIYLHHLETGRKEQLTNFPGLNGAPSFSPDGKQLAMVLSKGGNPDIYVLDLATRALRRVTRHREIDTEPDWTSDGSAIVFTSNRGAQPQIYRVFLDNLRVERLTYEGDYNARARMLPDNNSLVMVHRREGIFHISLLDMQRRRLFVLTETSLDESPSVAPNGSMLIYATKQNGKDILAAVAIDGGVKFNLPAIEGDVREPAWSPHKEQRFRLLEPGIESAPDLPVRQ